MERNTPRLILLYAFAALAVIVLGGLVLKSLPFILFFSFVVLMFTVTIIALIKKLAFLEKQNDINLERFAVSMEHVNHVLFDNVLEADMTNDRLIGENAQKLTAQLGLPDTATYSETIDKVSREMVQEKFSQDYRRTLSVANVMKTLEQGSNTLEFECIERSDGKNYRWIRAHYCIYRSSVTDCVKIISYVKNIEEEKRAYDRLIEKATTDPMTGLLNKMSTKEIVTNLLSKNLDKSSTILMIDIDNFKNINDRYGHDVGDEVIISICGIIKSNFRDTAIIGRMGGDEFLVYLQDRFERDNVQQTLVQLLSEVQKFSVKHNRHTVEGLTVSIGIVDTFGNENFDQLYHYADAAMYKAKAMGKNQYFLYDYAN